MTASSTTAAALLRALSDRGVDYFFGNGGTDFASIIEAFAEAEATGAPVPVPVTVPHEMVAASMAHGYQMVTGRTPAVMVHVNVGTANVLNGVINAGRGRVPILFLAGRNPISETGSPASRNASIHWAQESFDQGSMVREWVKWDYELRHESPLETVVGRALAIAESEPQGPVYLSLPREVLAEPRPAAPGTRVAAAARLAHPEPEGVAEAARALAAARNPLIVTSAAGQDPAAVPALVRLAERLGIPVVEPTRYFMNFPTTHPLHVGYDTGRLVPEADCIVVVDTDMPWYPGTTSPAESATVIHIGPDVLRVRYPLWGFPVDIPITARPAAALDALVRAIDGEGADEAAVGERTAKWATVSAKQRVKRRAWSEARAGDTPIDFAWVSRCIGDAKDDETICINEYDLAFTQADFTVPGTFFGLPPSGGLGWGLGAALGAKLGAPDRTVIACVGDGAYMFGAPTVAHWVSRARDLPVLTVVFNNESWGAVRDTALAVHPDGYAARADPAPFTDLRPSPDFEDIVGACGGHGERVEDPAALPDALARCLKMVRDEGRQALLNVICRRP